MKRTFEAVQAGTGRAASTALAVLTAVVLGLCTLISLPPLASSEPEPAADSATAPEPAPEPAPATEPAPAPEPKSAPASDPAPPADREPSTGESTDSAPARASSTASTFRAGADPAPVTIAQAAAPVGLGTADSFAVLAGATVTNTGPTVINGDLGVSPGSAVTGFPPGIVKGVIHKADAVALQAKSDLAAAYTDAAGRTCGTSLTGMNLGGLTLSPGVYCFASSAQLTGTLTLDFQGDPNAVFIFQIGSTLTTASNSRVRLINANGGQGCNVFWQVGSSATLGTGTRFVGNILALESITATTGATVDGRLLADAGGTGAGAATLDSNTVTRSRCSTSSGGGTGGGAVPVPDGTGGGGTGDQGAGGEGTRRTRSDRGRRRGGGGDDGGGDTFLTGTGGGSDDAGGGSAGDGRLATTGGSVLLMLLLGSVTLAAGLRLRARVGSLSA